jgi:HAD superfamily hydrolase (TIGR01509 family)
MVGALFCEVEDVLANTAPLRHAALRRAIAESGVAHSAQPARSDNGVATGDAVRHALHGHERASDEPTISIIAHRADRLFAELVASGISLCPGAREFVERAARQCRLAIVTRMERASVELVLSSAELEGMFEVTISSEDVTMEKPSPDAYRRAFVRMSRKRPLDLRECVAVESSVAGVRAAHAAGMRCVAIGDALGGAARESDVCLPSLVEQTPDSIDAMLSIEAAG